MKNTMLSVLLAGLLLAGCAASDFPEAYAAADSAVTREEAESAALKHAGLTADQVRFLRTEYEIDDGIPRYEVRFRYDGWEYDYEIHAQTGAVLSFDRDD